MKTIYLSLGSNLGDREANLRAAIERLSAPDVRVLRTSPVYETEPVDYTDQGWFLNLAVEARASRRAAGSVFSRDRATRCRITSVSLLA